MPIRIVQKRNEALKVNKPISQQTKPSQEGVEKIKEELDRLSGRTILLLSFKDTSTQNLKYVFRALGITTLEEKRRIVQEIFRLIRDGIVYIPQGLPELVENGIEDSTNLGKINLCLLRPVEHLIQEVKREISQIKGQLPEENL
ncbi:MAG: hypothetical protein ACFE9L_16070 [Candidatus Hodarchaeota archaeon]